ncbi:MAG: DUF3089 domain-containing protein [Cyclobacteriaceae bacterium]|nr:DUF3089 domain-containing protein [Cyclobacteriaceae bacterium]
MRYQNSPIPTAPDYSRSESWAALPTKVDAADSTPRKSTLTNDQASAKADVFFVYPTIFTGTPKNEYQWNADVNDAELNNNIQRSTLLNQATAFNGACRVFAPYYRQAHLFAFYTPNQEDGKKALDLAYEDVKAAFEYYLANYNEGRPIVIASHSQGSYHGERLLQDYFDGKELQNQLVAAYLIGRAISPQAFKNISPTKSPDEIGVWASWNTFARNYIPKNYERYRNALSINPLLWNANEDYTSNELNKGGVGLKFTYAPHLVDAQNHQGILWVSRPNIKGSWLFRHKVWHRADINFFYMNIRENVAVRVENFTTTKQSDMVVGH